MNNSVLAIIKNGKIELITNCFLPEGTKLLITPISDYDESEKNWHNLALKGLDDAYSEDEPDYGLDQIKEFNLDYEGS